MLVYLLIPVALAVVFFTMSFFQREAAVVNVVEKEKPKDKKIAKKPTGVKKPVQKKPEKEEQEKTISQKNFTEEIDIKELATMQGKIEKPVVAKKEKKEDEKKVEVKEAPKEVVAAVESKKKQKKSDWVTKEVKPQRVKPEETEEKKEEEKKTEKKGEKRGGDKDRKRGDKKGDKKRGDKKGEEEGESKEPKSIYKVFKPHGAEADKVEVKPEEKKEEVAAVEEEKKEKKERGERLPQKPRLKMKYNAYKSSEDFWETNIADSYVEPAEITTVSPVPTEEKAEKQDKKEKKEKGTKKGDSREPAPAVQIKVNRQVSLARTDPWAKTDSSSQATTSDNDADYFPALGEKNAPKKTKKVNKASETEPTVASPQKKSDSHKREANDTLFEYNAEAPADKKIKLGEEVENQNSKEEETFVLPSE